MFKLNKFNRSILSKLVSLRAKRSNLIVERLLRRFAPRNDTLRVSQKCSLEDINYHNLDTNVNRSILICFSMAVVCIVSGSLLGNRAFAQEKIVAIVNNEVITQKDLDDFIGFMRLQLSAEYKGRQLENRIQSLKNDLLNRLIDDRLILQEAKKNNVKVDENRIKAKIDDIRKRYGSDLEFQSTLQSQGIVQADLEQRAREQMLMYNIIDEQIRKNITISPVEVTDFYQQNTKLFRTPSVWDFETVTFDDEGKALEIFNGLQNGEKLEELAVKQSFSINKLNVKEGELRKEIEDVIVKLQPQGTSKPIKIEDKYYIFRLNLTHEGRQESLPESIDTVNNALFNKKMEESMANWISQLRNRSYIKVIK